MTEPVYAAVGVAVTEANGRVATTVGFVARRRGGTTFAGSVSVADASGVMGAGSGSFTTDGVGVASTTATRWGSAGSR